MGSVGATGKYSFFGVSRLLVPTILLMPENLIVVAHPLILGDAFLYRYIYMDSFP